MSLGDSAPLEDGAATPPDPDGQGTLVDAVHIVDALGVAFATFQLFHEASTQPAFRSAVDRLTGAARLVGLEVASDHFMWARRPVTASHPGAARLAAQLFGHGIAAVRFTDALSAGDLDLLFDVIRHKPGDPSLEQGVGATLLRRGVSSLRLMERTALRESDEEVIEDPSTFWGTPPEVDASEFSGDAEGLAHHLLTAAGNDPEELVRIVAERYSGSIAAIDENDVWTREELVHTFIDAFFHMPKSFQGPLLTELLARREVPEFQLLLDQFAHHELRELAAHLDSVTHPLLLEYARMSYDDDQPIDDLYSLLVETTPERRPVLPVISRVAGVLRSGPGAVPPARQAIHRLQEQAARLRPRSQASADVMSGLLALHLNPAQADRLLRTWARKLMELLRDGDAAGAVRWAEIVLADDRLETDTAEVHRALVRASNAEAIRTLVDVSATDDGAQPVVERLCEHLMAPLIDFLAVEGDAHRRRAIIAMLGRAVRKDSRPVVAALDDPRWYLIRNLVLILKHSTNPADADPVAALASHPDARVRREVLRTLHALGEDSYAAVYLDAITDDDRTVRTAAATVLRATEQLPSVLPYLLGIIDGNASLEVKTDVIELLTQLDSREARLALERLTRRRLATTSTTRALRNAARRALEQQQ